MPESQTQPMGISEAAEYLGIPKGSLYKLTSKRKITHYKPTGGRIFFLQEDLDDFIRQGKHEAEYPVYAPLDRDAI